MFTGIVEEMGTIRQIQRGRASAVLTIGAHKVLEDAHIGDSIAVNGICLTVTSLGGFAIVVPHGAPGLGPEHVVWLDAFDDEVVRHHDQSSGPCRPGSGVEPDELCDDALRRSETLLGSVETPYARTVAEEVIGHSLAEAMATYEAMRAMLTSRGTDSGDEEVIGDGVAFAGVAQYRCGAATASSGRTCGPATPPPVRSMPNARSPRSTGSVRCRAATPGNWPGWRPGSTTPSRWSPSTPSSTRAPR